MSNPITFFVEGMANIKHINVRKEGPDDDKILAVDVKLGIEKIDRAICAYFDEAIVPFLWKEDGEAMFVRNIWMQPVAYGNEIEGATVEIAGQTFHGCDIKKFSLSPRDGGLLDLTCSVTLMPSSLEVADLARYVQDYVRVKLAGPASLFDDAQLPKAA